MAQNDKTNSALPVQFVKNVGGENYQLVGNRVQLEDGAGNPIGSSNPSPANPIIRGTLTDRNTTITQANVSQQLAPANPNRSYFIFQNVSDTDMSLDFGQAAIIGTSFLCIPKASFVMEDSFISTQSINVICATQGKAYAAKEG